LLEELDHLLLPSFKNILNFLMLYGTSNPIK